MKIKITLMLTVAVGLFVLSPGVLLVNAQTDPATEGSTDTVGEQTKKEQLDARRAERKAAHEARINQARTDRASGRCVAAQKTITNATNRATNVKASRASTYNNISAKLQKIIDRLDAAEIDSTLLAAEASEFDALVTDFFETFDSYIVAIQDAGEIDCIEDTEGFLLALEDAKAMRAKLKDDAGTIKIHVRETITATLNEIKKSLSTDDATSEEA